MKLELTQQEISWLGGALLSSIALLDNEESREILQDICDKIRAQVLEQEEL